MTTRIASTEQPVIVANEKNISTHSPSFRRSDYEKSPKQDEFSKEKNNTLRNTAIGAGAAIILAALADCAFAHGKHVKKLLGIAEKETPKTDVPKPSETPIEDVNSEINKLKNEIDNLKLRIHNEYMRGISEIDDKYAGPLINFDKTLIGKQYIASSKDLDLMLRMYADETTKIEKKSLVEHRKVVDDVSSRIRNRLVELSGDSDWCEMRSLFRKSRKKVLKNDGDAIDYIRTNFLPDIIISMIEGKPNQKLEALGLSISDAINFVKSDSCVEEYYRIVNSKSSNQGLKEILDNKIGPYLMLGDVFNCFGIKNAKESMIRIKTVKRAIDRIEKLKTEVGEQMDHDREALIQRIRSSEDTTKLKELVAKLKSLEAKKKD